MNESFVRVRVFSCMYVRDPGDEYAVPIGPTIGDLVTEFFDNEDAWPLSQSLTLTPVETDENGRETLTHWFTMSWIPRTEHVKMQAEIVARANQITEAQLASIFTEDNHAGADSEQPTESQA